MKEVIDNYPYNGTVYIPASKSDSQRAILCAALAHGESVIKNFGASDDEKAMLNSVIKLGASVDQLSTHEIKIRGIERLPDYAELHAGESGLSLRLLTTLCAVIPGNFKINGKGSLKKRPMYFFDHLFPRLGCEFKSDEGHIPFEINGQITEDNFSVDGSQSSQYISGLLIALPLKESSSFLKVVALASIPYVRMTIHTLEAFGIYIEQNNYEDFSIAGKQRFQPCEYTVEGDWSSASYWLTAAALGCKIQVSGLQMASLQADKEMLNALMNANCTVLFEEDGISVDGSKRKPFEFDATNCPDLFPALATLAAGINGTSKIRGVKRLKDKESDRGVVLQKEFKRLGLKIELEENVMLVYGTGQLKGGKVNSHGDHRIAMCMAIAALLTDGNIEISGAQSVSKSYPSFWSTLSELKMKSL